ncbi:MAG: DNA recombination protein RmuC, partial [Pseudomonadota bacterium]|nr:DNA recombination protein RmuC [Pseudomonadota bacterium]
MNDSLLIITLLLSAATCAIVLWLRIAPPRTRIGELGMLLKNQLDQMGGEIGRGLSDVRASGERQQEALRTVIDRQLTEIRDQSASKLDAMRQTVDEKLQTTLEKRIGDSFKQVSERLEQVHQGLGEMQTLANRVGNLQRMLGGVKTRGIFGEVQLSALLEQTLPPERVLTNAPTDPESRQRVEFAVVLPGRGDG